MNIPLLALRLNLEPWKKRISTSHIPVSFCTLLEILNSIWLGLKTDAKVQFLSDTTKKFLACFWRDILKLA